MEGQLGHRQLMNQGGDSCLGKDLKGLLPNESTVSQNWVPDFPSSLCGQIDSKGAILILSEPSVRGPSPSFVYQEEWACILNVERGNLCRITVLLWVGSFNIESLWHLSQSWTLHYEFLLGMAFSCLARMCEFTQNWEKQRARYATSCKRRISYLNFSFFCYMFAFPVFTFFHYCNALWILWKMSGVYLAVTELAVTWPGVQGEQQQCVKSGL